GVPRRRRLLRGIGTVESLTGFLRSQGCADLLPVVQVVFDAGDLLHGLVATPGDEYCIRRSGLRDRLPDRLGARGHLVYDRMPPSVRGLCRGRVRTGEHVPPDGGRVLVVGIIVGDDHHVRAGHGDLAHDLTFGHVTFPGCSDGRDPETACSRARTLDD